MLKNIKEIPKVVSLDPTPRIMDGNYTFTDSIKMKVPSQHEKLKNRLKNEE